MVSCSAEVIISFIVVANLGLHGRGLLIEILVAVLAVGTTYTFGHKAVIYFLAAISRAAADRGRLLRAMAGTLIFTGSLLDFFAEISK